MNMVKWELETISIPVSHTLQPAQMIVEDWTNIGSWRMYRQARLLRYKWLGRVVSVAAHIEDKWIVLELFPVSVDATYLGSQRTFKYVQR